MPEVIAIVGRGGSGKSALIRCLTGVRKDCGPVAIVDSKGNIHQVYVQINSLNEIPWDLGSKEYKKFLKNCSKVDVLLLALQPATRAYRRTKAVEYLNDLESKSFKVKEIFALDGDAVNHFIGTKFHKSVKNIPTKVKGMWVPANQISRDVRRIIGWI